MTTTTLQARLKDVQHRKRDLRDSIAAATADHARARERYIGNGNGRPDSDEFRAAERSKATLDGLQDQLAAAGEEERYVLQQIAGVSTELYGQSFLNDPSKLQAIEALGKSSAPIGRQPLGVGVAAEDVLAMIGQAAGGGIMAAAGETTIGDTARRGAHYGVVPQLRRPLRLLDLIPSAGMDGRSVEYKQEIGSFGVAAETAEGALKPSETWDWPEAEAVAKTIAHWTKLRKPQLADTPQLGEVVRNRLAYGVLRRLEAQIIAGNGTGENLRGILNTSGIGSVAYSASELAADQALEGITTVLLSEAQPSFVALHPNDWKAMLVARSSGSDEYHSAGPFAAQAERLWGTVAVPTPALPEGTVIVGDSMGCTLLVREGVNVIVSDADSDDLTRNRVTLLGEMRAALAVWQPSCFCEVELTE